MPLIDVGSAGGTHVTIDLDEYEQSGARFGIFGASGSGKGWLLGVLLEELHRLGYPIIAIDPESELHTLQEIGALVLGGPHGDAPIPTTVKVLQDAMRFAIRTGTPLVFDLGGTEGADGDDEAAIQREGVRIMQVFNRMADTLRTSVVFAVTEAELFAPQQVARSGISSKVFATIQKRGRKRGVIPILETQRTADIAKSVIAMCNVRFIGHLDEPLDYDNVKRHITGWTFEKMRRLPTGMFIKTPEEIAVTVKARTVTHGGGTPVAGDEPVARTRTSSAELDAMVEALRSAAPTPEPEEAGPVRAMVVGGRGGKTAEVTQAAIDAALRTANGRITELESSRDSFREMHAAAEREVDRLRHVEGEKRVVETVLATLREGLIAVLGDDATPRYIEFDGAAGGGLSEADVVRLIAQHAHTGAGSAAMVPVEALRVRFLEAAAQRLYEVVENLTDDERAVALFLIAHPTFHSINAIQKAITGSDGGGARKRWEDAILGVVRPGLAVIGGSGRSGRKENVDAWLRGALGAHEATDAEVADVKNRALALIANAR